jgi:hypothetical protein
MIQNDQSQREGHNIHHASKGNGFAALEIAEGCQRDIDQQAQGAHTDAEYMLNDGTDTVDTGGRELIWEDKQLIIQCSHKADTNDHKIR